MEITTIILVALVLVVLYFAYTTFIAPAPAPVEDDTTEKEEIKQREYTLEELRKNNGVTTDKILISVSGQVFDVSNAKQFYGPSSPYEMFAGHDATVNLAKQATDVKYLDTLDTSSLSIGEKDDLAGTIEHYSMKYEIVGWLKEWRDKYPEADKAK